MSTPTRNPHEAVAEEVRALLARRRISGRAAARNLGWKTDYMWRRLDGRTPMDINDLVAVASLLEVPVTALVSGLSVKVTKEGLSPGTPRTLPLSCIPLTSVRQIPSLVALSAA